LFGITFAIKLMERGERDTQAIYQEIAHIIPESKKIAEDENRHEEELIAMIDEERLRYVGSMVLGLNDALVELTGALAGFTLAFQNSRVVAMAGMITGIAASMSMATSSYLSTRTDEGDKNPAKAAVYTGTAYMLTVLFLVLPFMLLSDPLLCMTWTVVDAVIVIFVFTYYISVVKDVAFKRRFLEMCAISLSIAGLTFVIGFLVRTLFGIDI
jgi:VIT1/CCC1 family predicted Fe2+/Mn2+ transporter